MSKWNAWVLTKKGQALYAKVDAGQTKLVLTKMALGDGAPTDLENCTELANKVIEMDITKLTVQNETTCTVEAALNTTKLNETLTVAEWGLYATDPDDGEILLGIATDADPDKVEPSGGVAAYEQTMGMTLVTSSAADVSISIDSSAFVTKSSLDDAMADVKEKNFADINATKEELTALVSKSAADMKVELETDIDSRFASQYSQVTKLNTAALKGVYIPVEATTDFCRPPLEVLKLRDDGISETLTTCDFTAGDASDFNENTEVTFDGTMHLNTRHEISMTTPTEFAAGTISVSDEIDLTAYQDVAEVKVS